MDNTSMKGLRRFFRENPDTNYIFDVTSAWYVNTFRSALLECTLSVQTFLQMGTMPSRHCVGMTVHADDRNPNSLL